MTPPDQHRNRARVIALGGLEPWERTATPTYAVMHKEDTGRVVVTETTKAPRQRTNEFDFIADLDRRYAPRFFLVDASLPKHFLDAFRSELGHRGIPMRTIAQSHPGHERLDLIHHLFRLERLDVSRAVDLAHPHAADAVSLGFIHLNAPPPVVYHFAPDRSGRLGRW
ncbi:hypothetical protein CcrBL47_gp400 [Caulobacter phage BL47]|nr:hypothetical protein CcrBL47_gp400 [Caulobacter phage BL47]